MKWLAIFVFCLFGTMGCAEASDWYVAVTGAPLPSWQVRAAFELGGGILGLIIVWVTLRQRSMAA